MSNPTIIERVVDLKLLNVGIRLNVGPKGKDESNMAYRLALDTMKHYLDTEHLYAVERPDLVIDDDPRRLPAGRRGPWWNRYATGRVRLRACEFDVGHVPDARLYAYMLVGPNA